MAISTKPGGKYNTENGQYVSVGSSEKSTHNNTISRKDNEKNLAKELKYEQARKKYKYSRKDYNDYGWARGNEILNSGQNADYKSKFAQAINGYEAFPRTSNDEFMIPVSEIGSKNEGVNNTIVYAKGTISKPIITRVVKIDVDNETEADLERRCLCDFEGRGVQPTNSTIFRFYNADDYKC